jgi:hypothetical protein
MHKLASLFERIAPQTDGHVELSNAMSKLSHSFRDCYEASNARLQDSVSIDLAQYGYVL